MTRAQLLALGVTRHQIGECVRKGYLIPVFRGVYAVGRLATTRRDRAHGALLACGAGSFLGGRSSAAVWGVFKRWTLPFELNTITDRRPNGVVVHLCTRATQVDVRTHWGLPVASPALTAIQLAPRMTEQRLTRMINYLRSEELASLDELCATVDRYAWHPGARLLRPMITEDHGPTRSEFEDAFQRLVDEHGLPQPKQPKFNTRVHGHLAGAYFEQAPLIVELDSWRWHRQQRKFESDRERDADLLAERDIATVRVTWKRLTTRATKLAAQLHRIIDRRTGDAARAQK